MKGMLL